MGSRDGGLKVSLAHGFLGSWALGVMALGLLVLWAHGLMGSWAPFPVGVVGTISS
jgi:hypothetical protein